VLRSIAILPLGMPLRALARGLRPPAGPLSIVAAAEAPDAAGSLQMCG
jgi:hypothetical protein